MLVISLPCPAVRHGIVVFKLSYEADDVASACMRGS
jgi:hypothetical protein